MKGTFFAQPLEYKLHVEGESWIQGSAVKGSLIVDNHSSDSVDLSKIGCHLCYCNSKKLKARDLKGISSTKSILFTEESSELSFEFILPDDCRITENTGSYYIVCGDIKAPFDGGMLELNVTPATTIVNFVEVFEQFFRFKFKKYKSKKDFIDVQVVAPSSKEWSRIQKMNLQMKMDGTNIEVKFIFSLKNVAFENSNATTKDALFEISRTIGEREYSIYGSTNQDGICKVINEVLDQVKLRPFV
ncbi:MAG: hypothetical protein KAG61_11075 [Bacteriovoracaceae bacterium]|nr:hypothetical protein [Bacteriovoracaceae bacterium]